MPAVPPGFPILSIALLAASAPLAAGGEWFVAPGGSDAADGRTAETPFRTVGHACDAAVRGDRVRLAPGLYPLARTAVLKGGVTLVGADRPWNGDAPDAPRFSTLAPGPDWPRAGAPGDNAPDEYLLRAEKHAADVTVRLVRFRGTVEEVGDEAGDDGAAPAVVTGAFHADQAAGLTLDRLTVDRFRLCGLRLLFCSDLTVAGCELTDAALERAPQPNGGDRWGGMIWTAWPENAVFSDCRLTGARSGGYGFKGGGSDGCRVTRCVVTGPYFSLEHPHDNEFGLEIDHCRFDGCISVPKGGPQTDPAERGHARSVRIHHNYLTDSYTVEGPRQYLEFDHNLVHVDRPGGRCYTHHGGSIPGPVLIHHNVFENVDRSVVWMNEGFFGGLKFYNNTVFAADAGNRAGHLFDAWGAERLDGWDVRNNLLVAAWSRPRSLRPDRNGVPGKMTFARNLFANLTDAPAAKNLTAAEVPGGIDALLTRAGAKPAPFYAPASADDFVVDRGEDVGLPFASAAPDVGAFEFDLPDDPWADWAVPGE